MNHRFANWIFSLLVRERDREMLLGDLIEEQALRPDSSRWYRRQMLRSVAPIVWANIRRGIWLRRGVWLKTLGATIAGYFVVVLVVMTGEVVMSKTMSSSETVYSLVSLAVGFVAMTLGGYLAAWIRPRAAAALAVMSALLGVVSFLLTGDRAPAWYQIALIVTGPAAALVGGRIRVKRRAQSDPRP